ncbi:MAG: DUF308 domain-containing protein [Endomicrobia bacterium]|nr:DUF308 domain-containing protein [Endomicrobiia bacterium]
MESFKTSKIMLCVMGVLMFILGLVALTFSKITLAAFALILGGGFVVAGIFCLMSFVSEKEILQNPNWVLIEGILNIFFGFFLLWNLGPRIVGVLYVIAFWMMFSGISKFAASFSLKRFGADKWWLVLVNGLLGIFTSCIIMFFPFFGTGFLTVLAGMYLMICGILICAESATVKIQDLKDLMK